jgi:hypothetical protein
MVTTNYPHGCRCINPTRRSDKDLTRRSCPFLLSGRSCLRVVESQYCRSHCGQVNIAEYSRLVIAIDGKKHSQLRVLRFNNIVYYYSRSTSAKIFVCDMRMRNQTRFYLPLAL